MSSLKESCLTWRSHVPYESVMSMMMIALITINSGLVPLIEGLCANNARHVCSHRKWGSHGAFHVGISHVSCWRGMFRIRTTHNARTVTLVPNKSVGLSASACQVSLHFAPSPMPLRPPSCRAFKTVSQSFFQRSQLISTDSSSRPRVSAYTVAG